MVCPLTQRNFYACRNPYLQQSNIEQFSEWCKNCVRRSMLLLLCTPLWCEPRSSCVSGNARIQCSKFNVALQMFLCDAHTTMNSFHFNERFTKLLCYSGMQSNLTRLLDPEPVLIHLSLLQAAMRLFRGVEHWKAHIKNTCPDTQNTWPDTPNSLFRVYLWSYIIAYIAIYCYI